MDYVGMLDDGKPLRQDNSSATFHNFAESVSQSLVALNICNMVWCDVINY